MRDVVIQQERHAAAAAQDLRCRGHSPQVVHRLHQVATLIVLRHIIKLGIAVFGLNGDVR